MVLSRRGLSAILLAAIALVLYLVLLSTKSSNAQTDGDITIDGESSIIQDVIIDEEVTGQEDEDLQEDVIIEEPTTKRQPQKEPTIINIPNKPLPPTGGLPVYGTVAGFIIVGAGLLGLGVGIRRGQRRR